MPAQDRRRSRRDPRRVSTPPVGLCGELRISSRVFAVIFASSSAGSNAKSRASRRMDRHRHRAIRDDLRLVDRESRHRIDHLVADAIVGDRGDRVGDERLGARADDDVVGRECRGRAARRGRAPPPRAARRCRPTAYSRACRRGWRRSRHPGCCAASGNRAGRCRTRRCPCPAATSALTSASTTKAFSVPSDSPRRDSGGTSANGDAVHSSCCSVGARCGVRRARRVQLAKRAARPAPACRGRRSSPPPSGSVRIMPFAAGEHRAARARRCASRRRRAPDARASHAHARSAARSYHGRSRRSNCLFAQLALQVGQRDLHRAHDAALVAQRRRLRQVQRILEADVHRRQDRADRARDRPSRTSGRRRSGRPGSGSCTRRSGCSAAPRRRRLPSTAIVRYRRG